MMGTILNNKSSEGTIRVDTIKQICFLQDFFGSMVSNKSHSSGKICSSISALKSIGLLSKGGGFSRMSAAVTYGRFPSSSGFSLVLLVDKKTSKDIPQC